MQVPRKSPDVLVELLCNARRVEKSQRKGLFVHFLHLFCHLLHIPGIMFDARSSKLCSILWLRVPVERLQVFLQSCRALFAVDGPQCGLDHVVKTTDVFLQHRQRFVVGGVLLLVTCFNPALYQCQRGRKSEGTHLVRFHRFRECLDS